MVVRLSSCHVVTLLGCHVVGFTGQLRDSGHKQAEGFLPQRTPRFKLIRCFALLELHSFILRLSFSRSQRKKLKLFLSNRDQRLSGCRVVEVVTLSGCSGQKR